MDDFGMLARDFGFRAQGKSAPMKSSSSSDDNHIINDVFGGPPKFTNNRSTTSATSDIDYDSIFSHNETKSKSSLPVYDKPVYDDDDIFDGLPGMKSKSMHSVSGDDNIFFASMTGSQSDHFDDLLGNLGGGRNKTSSGFDDLFSGFGTASTFRYSAFFISINSFNYFN